MFVRERDELSSIYLNAYNIHKCDTNIRLESFWPACCMADLSSPRSPSNSWFITGGICEDFFSGGYATHAIGHDEALLSLNVPCVAMLLSCFSPSRSPLNSWLILDACRHQSFDDVAVIYLRRNLYWYNITSTVVLLAPSSTADA